MRNRVNGAATMGAVMMVYELSLYLIASTVEERKKGKFISMPITYEYTPIQPSAHLHLPISLQS